MLRAFGSVSTIAIFAVHSLAWVGGVQAADWTSAQDSQIDARVAHFMRERHPQAPPAPPSLSLAIGLNGRLLIARGYGEARAGHRATERTVYHIGSLTKQFTAAAVLRLIEERSLAPLSGAPLSLDTDMSEIFSGVHAWTTRDEPPITIRSLLNMTSNLPNFTRRPPPNVDPWGAVPAPRLLGELKKISPRGWPHSFEYSNTSYFLLAQVIAASRNAPQETAASYRDYIRAATITTAGLTGTGFVGDMPPGADLAEPHFRRRPAFAKPDWLNGSGDMESNALDIFAWNRALMAGAIIGPDSLKAMFGDGGRVGPLTYYGMGWFIEHEQGWDSYFHSGSVPGYTSYNAILKRQGAPDWLSVTLLTNADGVEGLDALADELADVVRAAIAQQD